MSIEQAIEKHVPQRSGPKQLKELVVDGSLSKLSIEELEPQLSSQERAMALAYVTNGRNTIRAYMEGFDDHLPPGETYKGKEYNRINTRSQYYLRKSVVSAYIVAISREMGVIARSKLYKSYDQWADKLVDLSDTAVLQGNMGASVRAHELLGKSLGHLDDGRLRGTQGMTDSALIAKLAGIGGDLAAISKRALGIRDTEVIDVTVQDATHNVDTLKDNIDRDGKSLIHKDTADVA